MGVLVLAVVAAGLAALLARGLVSSDDAPSAPKVVEAPTEQVLVTSTVVARGERLTANKMRWQNWPETALSDGYVTRSKMPHAIADMTGNLARTSLGNGEPITIAKVVNVETGGFMAALIAPGKRAVAITVSPETGAGGFILPNDHVDIIHTRHVRQDGPQGSQDIVQGEILLHDIRVLAIDQQFKDGGEPVAIGKTATLELTAAQAERVTVAQAEGPLTLSLRGLGEKGNANDDNALSSEAESSSVSVVRYGARSTVRVR
jgi:pilus assembly protein CpaB